MSAWPADLFRKAFQEVWENYRYRRFPGAADFKACIADDLAARSRLRSQGTGLWRRNPVDPGSARPDLAERQRVGQRFGELARQLAHLALSLEMRGAGASVSRSIDQ